MNNASPFHNISPSDDLVTVTFDGIEYVLPNGANLAASLLEAGLRSFRNTPVSGALRGPFCMMGACYDCLVEIDGETRQACMTAVTSGLKIERAHRDKGLEND